MHVMLGHIFGYNKLQYFVLDIVASDLSKSTKQAYRDKNCLVMISLYLLSMAVLIVFLSCVPVYLEE